VSFAYSFLTGFFLNHKIKNKRLVTLFKNQFPKKYPSSAFLVVLYKLIKERAVTAVTFLTAAIVGFLLNVNSPKFLKKTYSFK
jgi:hypothetical protein